MPDNDKNDVIKEEMPVEYIGKPELIAGWEQSMESKKLATKQPNNETAISEEIPHENINADNIAEQERLVKEKLALDDGEKPTFNFKEEFGETMDTPEKIKEALKNHEITKSQAAQLKSELDLREQKIKELEGNLFANETLYKLNEIAKTKPEDYPTYLNLVFNKQTPLEILEMKFVKDNPDYKDKMDEVKAFIEGKYDVDEVVDTEDLQQLKDKRNRMIQLDIDSKEARRELLKDFDEIKVPEKVDLEKIESEKKEKELAQEKEIKTGWDEITPKVITDFKVLPIFTKGKNDENPKHFMDFEISDDMRKQYGEEMNDFLVSNKKPLNKESIGEAISYIENRFFLDNKEAIFQTVADKARAMNDEEYALKYHNPSAKKEKNGNIPPGSDDANTKNDAVQRKVIEYAQKQYGIKF